MNKRHSNHEENQCTLPQSAKGRRETNTKQTKPWQAPLCLDKSMYAIWKSTTNKLEMKRYMRNKSRTIHARQSNQQRKDANESSTNKKRHSLKIMSWKSMNATWKISASETSTQTWKIKLETRTLTWQIMIQPNTIKINEHRWKMRPYKNRDSFKAAGLHGAAPSVKRPEICTSGPKIPDVQMSLSPS